MGSIGNEVGSGGRDHKHSKGVSYGSVCLLCLRLKTCTSVRCDADNHNQGRQACVRYIALVSRYLNLDTKLSTISERAYWDDARTAAKPGLEGELESLHAGGKDKPAVGNRSLTEEISKFVICDSCLPIANSFCEAYKQYEYIRLKLHEKVYEASSLIVKSSGLDESIKALHGVRRKSEAEDTLTNFRTMLKCRGSEFVRTAAPRLALKRSKKAEELAATLKVSKKLLFIDGKPTYVPVPTAKAKTAGAASELNSPVISVITPFTTAVGATVSTNNATLSSTVASQVTGTAVQALQHPPIPHHSVQNTPPIRFSHPLSPPSTFPKSKTLSHSKQKTVAQPTGTTSQNMKTVVADLPIEDIQRSLQSVLCSPSVSNFLTPGFTTASVSAPPAKVINPTNVISKVTQKSIPKPGLNGIVSNGGTSNLPIAGLASPNLPQPPLPVTLIQTQLSVRDPPPDSIQRCKIDGCSTSFLPSFEGRWCMQAHLSKHKTLHCPTCHAGPFSPFELISHELEHESFEDDNFSVSRYHGFKCSRCDFTSSVRSEYQEHFLLKHLDTKVELMKCMQCKRGFSHTKEKQYTSHISNCHPKKNELHSMSYFCNFCKAPFKKESMLWKHLKNDHRINSREGKFNCLWCPKAYHTQQFLELHQEYDCSAKAQSETLKKVCPDPNCGANFTSLHSLKKHIRDHGPDFKMPECPVCKEKFYEYNTLKYHVITHNGEQVKLIFSDGSNVDPLVVPVPPNTMTSVPLTSLAATEEPPPLGTLAPPSASPLVVEKVDLDLMGHSDDDFTPLPGPSAQTPQESGPVIMSVASFAPPYNTFLTNTTATSCNNMPFVTPRTLPTNAMMTNTMQLQPEPSALLPQAPSILQVDKVGEPMAEILGFDFDESNESDESLVFFNHMPMNDEEDVINQPEEDPFAWIVSDDFLIQ